MKIKKIHIAGYRSLKDITWVPGDLNMIIGPNGTGKSNLLRFFELLVAASKGRLAKHIQKSGGIKPILWDGKVDSFSFRLETSSPAVSTVHWEDCLTYEALIRQIGYGSDYQVENELLKRCDQPDASGDDQSLILFQRHKQQATVYNTRGNEMIAPDDAVQTDELLLATAANPFSDCKQINAFQKGLSSWIIYHDLQVHQESSIRQPAISRYETNVSADGQNLISVLHTLYTSNRDFKNNIDTAMQAAFSSEYEELVFPPAADQRIQLRIRWKSLEQEQSAADLSDGTLYFLLLMAILNNPRPPALIAIDEPETGLHPSMLPVIAEHALEASYKTQVIFTTHSSQLLDAFHDTKPVTTVARWQNGETIFKVLDGEELNYWLRTYTLGSLFTSGELEDM
ncbi:MAG: AAA family ATPase [Bacillota bacterium]|jgi:predicted ATPase|nr:AAA family ATPase [Bacillota bacterium]